MDDNTTPTDNVDEKYEFAAPQFHDFGAEAGAADDDQADTWFDEHEDSALGLDLSGEHDELDSSLVIAENNPWMDDEMDVEAVAKSARDSPVSHHDAGENESDEEEVEEAEEDANNDDVMSVHEHDEDTEEQEDDEVEDDQEFHRFTVPDIDAKSNLLRPTSASLAKRKSQENARKRKRPSTANATTGRSHTGLTVPKTPTFHSTTRSRPSRLLTTEEQELLEIEELRKKESKRRKLNKKHKKSVLAQGHDYAPTRSTKALTEPQEFAFRTDARLKGVPEASPSTHSMKLRRKRPATASSSSSSSSQPRGLTNPKPFNFRVDRRATSRPADGSNEAHSPYHSLAESVMQMNTKTPQRYRTKPNNRKEYSPPTKEAKAAGRPKLTRARSPKFNTDRRLRPSTEKSTEERELEELAKVPAFKARPLSARVMHSNGNVGVPRVRSQPVTKPTDFHFRTEERSHVRPQETEEERDARERAAREFKARPLKEGVLFGSSSGSSHVHVEKKQLTVAESPALRTKVRGLSKPAPQAPQEPSPEPFKARPIMVAKPFVPSVQHKAPTQPEEFALNTEARGSFKQEMLRAYLEEEEQHEAAMKQFKARPLPIDQPMIPKASNKAATQPRPFHLLSEERGEEIKAAFEEYVAEEQQMQKEAANFKARPAPQSKAFMVKKSVKPLTDINDFQLNSDHRAQERQVFETAMKQKEARAEADKKAREAELKLQEEEEIRELRKKMTFKARPIMHSKGFVGLSEQENTQGGSKSTVSRNMRV